MTTQQIMAMLHRKKPIIMNTTETNDQNPWRPLEPGEEPQPGDKIETRCSGIIATTYTRRPRPAPTPATVLYSGENGTVIAKKDSAPAAPTTNQQEISSEVVDVNCLPPCSDHPDAPHGFDRDGSHTAGRYVCDCEGWVPPQDSAPAAPECQCDMRTKLVGDGCAVCNPELHAEYCAPESGERAGGGGHKTTCQCRLCQRGRQFHEIIKALPPVDRHWMEVFYDCVLDTECELEMREAADKLAGGGDQIPPVVQESMAQAERGELEPMFPLPGGGDQQTAVEWVADRIINVVNRLDEESTYLCESDAYDLADRADRAEAKIEDLKREATALPMPGTSNDWLANHYDPDTIRDDPPENDYVKKLAKLLAKTLIERSKARRELDALRLENGALRATIEARRAERDALREALEAMLEPQTEDCRFDHHGYCQAHYLQNADSCCVARARAALKQTNTEK